MGDDIFDQPIGLATARQVGNDDQRAGCDDGVFSDPDEYRASMVALQVLQATLGDI